MATYLTFFDYAGDAWRRMVARPEDREEAARRVIEAAGGSLVAYYWMFGAHDGLAIFEAPTAEAAGAVLVSISASGLIAGLETTRLLTGEEARTALELAQGVQPAYSPPGGDWREGYDQLGG